MSAIQTETSTLIPTGTWTVDPVHSSIRFDVVDTDSMMKSISGRFTDFEGTVEGGEEQSAQGVVRTPSVLTDNEMRDEHLRSNDLLGTDRYPEITFKSRPDRARRRRPPQDLRRPDRQGGRDPGRAGREVPGDGQGRRRSREDALPRRGRDRVGPDARRDHRRHHRGACVTKILGISGSLRERSYNTALLRAAAELVPPDAEIEALRPGRDPALQRRRRVGRRPRARGRAAGRGRGGRRAPARDSRVQPRDVRRAEERDRLALAAGARVRAALEAGGDHGRLERPRGTRRAQQQVRDALLFPGAIVLEQPRSRFRSRGSASTRTCG